MAVRRNRRSEERRAVPGFDPSRGRYVDSHGIHEDSLSTHRDGARSLEIPRLEGERPRSYADGLASRGPVRLARGPDDRGPHRSSSRATMHLEPTCLNLTRCGPMRRGPTVWGCAGRTAALPEGTRTRGDAQSRGRSPQGPPEGTVNSPILARPHPALSRPPRSEWSPGCQEGR